MAKKNKASLKYPRRQQFTIAEIIAINDNLNAQTVRTHVRAALKLETVRIVGRARVTGRGRPAFILSLA